MLTISRKTGQIIAIGDDIRIHVGKSGVGGVRLHIEAPGMNIWRIDEPNEHALRAAAERQERNARNVARSRAKRESPLEAND